METGKNEEAGRRGSEGEFGGNERCIIIRFYWNA